VPASLWRSLLRSFGKRYLGCLFKRQRNCWHNITPPAQDIFFEKRLITSAYTRRKLCASPILTLGQRFAQKKKQFFRAIPRGTCITRLYTADCRFVEVCRSRAAGRLWSRLARAVASRVRNNRNSS
jgi:hypothetical protein